MEEQTHPSLNVQRIFEPNRFAQMNLEEAYALILPKIHWAKRRSEALPQPRSSYAPTKEGIRE